MTITKNSEKETEVIDFCCANCGENNWKLYLAYHDDGQVELVLRCGDEKCLQELKDELGVVEEEGEIRVIWRSFDITDSVQEDDDELTIIPGGRIQDTGVLN